MRKMRRAFYAATFQTVSHSDSQEPRRLPGGKEAKSYTVGVHRLRITCIASTAGPVQTHRKPSPSRSHGTQEETDATGIDHQQRRPGKRVRLVQRPLGHLLANHAAVLTDAMAAGALS